MWIKVVNNLSLSFIYIIYILKKLNFFTSFSFYFFIKPYSYLVLRAIGILDIKKNVFDHKLDY